MIRINSEEIYNFVLFLSDRVQKKSVDIYTTIERVYTKWRNSQSSQRNSYLQPIPTNMRFKINTEQKTVTLYKTVPVMDLQRLLSSFSGDEWLNYTLINGQETGNQNSAVLPGVHGEPSMAGEFQQPPRSGYADLIRDLRLGKIGAPSKQK